MDKSCGLLCADLSGLFVSAYRARATVCLSGYVCVFVYHIIWCASASVYVLIPFVRVCCVCECAVHASVSTYCVQWCDDIECASL